MLSKIDSLVGNESIVIFSHKFDPFHTKMHDALNASGHLLFFSMCEWGVKDPATWAKPIGNSWRTTGDIVATWTSWTKILDENDKWWTYAGPGGWNDPDMLEVDNGDMSEEEQRAHFTLWCLIKAPLILGMDLRSISDQALELITNEEVIGWNQDRLGVQGHKVSQTELLESNGEKNVVEVWASPLDKGHYAIVLFNRGTTPQNITADWTDIELPTATAMKARDVWQRKDIGTFARNFTSLVEPHSVVAVELIPQF